MYEKQVHNFLVVLVLIIFIIISACDQYNGMTKHINARMLNNLEPSDSLAQNHSSVLDRIMRQFILLVMIAIISGFVRTNIANQIHLLK